MFGQHLALYNWLVNQPYSRGMSGALNSIQIEGDSAVFDQTSGNIIYSGSVI